MTTEAYESRYAPPLFGKDAEPEDAAKYTALTYRILALMSDCQWRSILEICEALNVPPVTRVDSRLRDLRKDDFKKRFGAWHVGCQRFADGVYRYRVTKGEE